MNAEDEKEASEIRKSIARQGYIDLQSVRIDGDTAVQAINFKTRERHFAIVRNGDELSAWRELSQNIDDNGTPQQ